MATYDPTGLPDRSAEESIQNGQDVRADGDEDDDYDPSSVSVGGNDAQQDASNAAAMRAPEQASKPKTAAGFIIEDDSDEEEQGAAPEPFQPNGTEGARSGEAARDVSLASAPTQDSAAAQTAKDSLNGSTAATTVPAVSNPPLRPSSAVPAPTASLPNQQDEGKTDIPPPARDTPSVSAAPKPSVNGITASLGGSVSTPPTAQRLPHDKVGRLEDRIKDDPKADTAAWTELIQHYREKDQPDNVRRVYERMLEVFSTASSLWTQYAQMEVELSERSRLEQIFNTSLPHVPNVDLWSMYLDYIRRICPLINDPQGQNRAIVLQAFEAVLDTVGIDPDSGKLWREYIDFAKSGQGVIGGTGWQDQQKADLVRHAYQRAIKVPSSELVKLWKEYDNFEMSLNKANGRKALQEQSPHYMQARSAKNKLDEKIEGLDRKSLPILPPLHGCEGDDEFATQVEKWRDWIEWEKSDPLVLKEDELSLYRKRVIYVYKQACMQLRFYPTAWFEAAQWCFDQAASQVDADQMETQGEDFLERGIAANPESVLLALKKADRIETSLDASTTDDVAIANGEKLDVPFENCHKALYALREKMAEREKKEIQSIKDHFTSLPPDEAAEELEAADEDEDEDSPAAERPRTRQELMQAQIKTATETSRARIEVVKRMISHVWIAKMRAFRRVQGQGMPKRPKKGFRGVFDEARPRGQLTSDVYIASALMEWHCYKDQAANKIFERGLKLFPTDESFALEYIKHMIANNDVTNARVVFETTMTKILGIKDTVMDEGRRKQKVRPLLGFMHHYESEYGDLAQIQKLERRMREMFPDEPELTRFANRFLTPNFDAMQEQIVISLTQARPKPSFQPAPQQPIPTTEMSGATSEGRLALGPNGPYIASPKRPLEDDDADMPSRKFMRAESPLKGAAGRRIQGGGHSVVNSTAGTIGGGGSGGSGFITKSYIPPNAPQNLVPQPAKLPPQVKFLLQILPPAKDYDSQVFDSSRMVGLLRGVDVEVLRPTVTAVGDMPAEQFSTYQRTLSGVWRPR